MLNLPTAAYALTLIVCYAHRTLLIVLHVEVGMDYCQEVVFHVLMAIVLIVQQILIYV